MTKISNTQRRKKNKKFGLFRKKLKDVQQNAKKAPKIGKPQKSGKHKKIKSVDPFYHGERKQALYEGINQKPTSLEQEIPRKALEVFELMKQTKQITKQMKKRKKKTKVAKKDHTINDDIPESPDLVDNKMADNRFTKRTNESDRRFLHRMNEEAKKAMLMARLADKWDAQVVEDADGEYRLKREKKPSEKKKRREAEKKELKRQKKEDKFIDGYQDFKTFEDHVEFGEIVHQPPTLSSLPRKATKGPEARKPGTKSLLLKDIMISNKVNNNNQNTTGKRQIGKTLKRKVMSPAQQQKLDIERDRVINVYRKMKDAKLKKT